MIGNEIQSTGHPLPSSPLRTDAEVRIAELEIENTRLQRLIAELLLKNQQLRRQQA